MVVVLQHQRRDLVGHLLEQAVALLSAQLAAVDAVRQQDLDVHLVVGGVHSSGVVDEIGVDQPAGERVLDPGRLGQAQVAALGDHPGPERAGVDPDRVVGPVPRVGVRLGTGLHVGADPAVPEQVGRGGEDRRDELIRGERPDVAVQAQRLGGGRRNRDGLGGPGPDATAGRDDRGIVVGPGGAGQREEPLPLRETGRRVRRRVDEDVPVVERRHQLDVLGEQHPVAEDVAGHVPDPGHREVRGVHVEVQGGEVELDRFPRAAGGDRHLLVVVALGPAGGERVTQPVPVTLRDLIGRVGEGRGALIRRDHQVGIIPVVPDYAGRRYHPARLQVVGDLQHGADEGPVAVQHLGLVGLPVRRVGQPLADEAALGAGRDDDRVLHLLRLGQAEDLGAEVFAAVRPAQPAPGHRAEPQVHRFQPG